MTQSEIDVSNEIAVNAILDQSVKKTKFGKKTQETKYLGIEECS